MCLVCCVFCCLRVCLLSIRSCLICGVLCVCSCVWLLSVELFDCRLLVGFGLLCLIVVSFVCGVCFVRLLVVIVVSWNCCLLCYGMVFF